MQSAAQTTHRRRLPALAFASMSWETPDPQPTGEEFCDEMGRGSREGDGCLDSRGAASGVTRFRARRGPGKSGHLPPRGDGIERFR